LAEDVVELAEDGDAVAGAILDEAAGRLSALLLATIDAAPFLDPDEHVVVGSGGVLRAGRIVSRLSQTLAEGASDYRLVVPDVPPVIGAWYLALREHGIPIPDTTRSRIVEQGVALQLSRKVLRSDGREADAAAEAMRTGSPRS
jgi:hypothetical protein